MMLLEISVIIGLDQGYTCHIANPKWRLNAEIASVKTAQLVCVLLRRTQLVFTKSSGGKWVIGCSSFPGLTGLILAVLPDKLSFKV